MATYLLKETSRQLIHLILYILPSLLCTSPLSFLLHQARRQPLHLLLDLRLLNIQASLHTLFPRFLDFCKFGILASKLIPLVLEVKVLVF
jgi:hypothetical protein